MRRIPYLAALSFLLAGSLSLQAAQVTDYGAIDRHALQAPPEVERTIAGLARYLVRPARNDAETARAIYRWVTDRIAYDAPALAARRIGDYRPESVLRSRLTVCEGYANLFQALCREAGLEAVKILGWARGDLAGLGKATHPGHAWNAVRIEGRWQLVEATWGAGSVNGKQFIKCFRSYYFLTPPEELVFSHYPVDSRWQLLRTPVLLREFTRMPLGAANLFEMGAASDQLRDLADQPDFRGLVKTFDLAGRRVTIRLAPLEHQVRAGTRYRFRIESPDFQHLAVISGRKWVHLQKRGNVFEAEVTAPEGKFVLAGRSSPGKQGKYNHILEYNGSKAAVPVKTTRAAAGPADGDLGS